MFEQRATVIITALTEHSEVFHLPMGFQADYCTYSFWLLKAESNLLKNTIFFFSSLTLEITNRRACDVKTHRRKWSERGAFNKLNRFSLMYIHVFINLVDDFQKNEPLFHWCRQSAAKLTPCWCAVGKIIQKSLNLKGKILLGISQRLLE